MDNILIDTDIGGDVEDAFAVALAVLNSTVNKIIGITTVTGDTILRARVARKLLRILTKSSIPIHAGIGNPKQMGDWEGKGILVRDDSNIYIPRNASDFIAQQINKYPGEIILVDIGPLSNIARALEINPDLPKKVKRLVLMGGFFKQLRYKGNKLPLAFEYNFCTDIKAFRAVFKANFPLCILPGDAVFVEESQWNQKELSLLKKSNRQITKMLMKLAGIWYKNLELMIKKANQPRSSAAPWLNDSILMAYILNPGLFIEQQLKISYQLVDNKFPLLKKDEKGFLITRIVPKSYKKCKSFILKQLT